MTMTASLSTTVLSFIPLLLSTCTVLLWLPVMLQSTTLNNLEPLFTRRVYRVAQKSKLLILAVNEINASQTIRHNCTT